LKAKVKEIPAPSLSVCDLSFLITAPTLIQLAIDTLIHTRPMKARGGHRLLRFPAHVRSALVAIVNTPPANRVLRRFPAVTFSPAAPTS